MILAPRFRITSRERERERRESRVTLLPYSRQVLDLHSNIVAVLTAELHWLLGSSFAFHSIFFFRHRQFLNIEDEAEGWKRFSIEEKRRTERENFFRRCKTDERKHNEFGSSENYVTMSTEAD